MFVDELTWTELRDDIAAGRTTIIVPIGGIEQNGPHTALGKHNVRVRALAERIARSLDNALVAPVLAYVPEGNINPPSAHMRFPGTITVPVDTFARLLESAARSFRLHGFRGVVFIGDHGGCQAALASAAQRTRSAPRPRAIEPAGEYPTRVASIIRSILIGTRGRPVTQKPNRITPALRAVGFAIAAAPFAYVGTQPAALSAAAVSVATVPGMPPVVDPSNLYSEQTAGKVSPVIANDLPRVYVPHVKSNNVYVIDPATFAVVDRFKVGINPQHIVPSWDLRTLWVANNAEGRKVGSATPIDPKTGKPGKSIAVDDPYNMYFSPDGKSVIVVAESYKRLDFRHPHTFALQSSLVVPECPGINHADFSIDGRYAIFTCEYQGKLAKVDLVDRKVTGYLRLAKGRMPQDIRISPDGKVFYVADMKADGLFMIDGDAFKEIGFIRTGVGAHGLYPSRDGTKLYVANRGSNRIHGKPKGKGSISVVDFGMREVETTWPLPGGGSPDMGNISADGKWLWLSARFDDLVYAVDTTSGSVKSIGVGKEPHGLTVWPQPGRYSLGHTGNMR